ncbi:dipeptide epimerase [Stakelama sp. CBK3Z-3]|uniref:Dipeptide epimerase n=1 Tax=Stakelama flava TaxID=2860338 RepID=A0ABS6XMY1_9SPHN|nr:dipeptide epimerase [Stakelama flava]MBW4330766.1 dipeptide epimerase [Stakelama flava]
MTRTLSVSRDSGSFRRPFRISGHVFTGIPLVRATIAEGGMAGRGEAGGVYFLGDDVDNILDRIEQARPAIEGGADRLALQSLLPPGGARNALDSALWELEAQQTGRPVWQLAGIERPSSLVTTYTLSADEPAAVGRALGGYADARALKLKLDGDRDADVARLRIVHQTRPDAWLMVDANQGYAARELPGLVPDLQQCGVRLIEQPVARGEEVELDGLDLPIPLFAEESVLSAADLPGLVGRFQGINIKLDKCGGLTEALKMVQAARQLGLKVMVGNMGGSSLAAAPAFMLGQLSDVVDLDGPKFLAEDLPGGAVYADGMISFDDAFWGGPSPISSVCR